MRMILLAFAVLPISFVYGDSSTPETTVGTIFRNEFGRNPTEEEMKHFTKVLSSGEADKKSLITFTRMQPEYRDQQLKIQRQDLTVRGLRIFEAQLGRYQLVSGVFEREAAGGDKRVIRESKGVFRIDTTSGRVWLYEPPAGWTEIPLPNDADPY